MKMRLSGFFAAGVALAMLAGCTIETPPEPIKGITAPGNDVVINEVFHVPLSQYNTYSWIELYNPTNRNINWYTETVLDDSTRLRERLVVRFRSRLRFYTFQASGQQVVSNPSYIIADTTGDAYFTNYHTDEVLSGFGLGLVDRYYSSSDAVIFPGQFAVIVSDQDKFDEHTLTGPFNPAVFSMTLSFQSLQGTPSPAVILPIHNPLDPRDPNYYWFGVNAIWDLVDSGEVALMRVTETVHLDLSTISPGDTTYLDVVRYGNYPLIQDPGGHLVHPPDDPFPGNNPVGLVPAGNSLARFGGYFKAGRAGSTADEFYFSPDPIPGWYNQRLKQ